MEIGLMGGMVDGLMGGWDNGWANYGRFVAVVVDDGGRFVVVVC